MCAVERAFILADHAVRDLLQRCLDGSSALFFEVSSYRIRALRRFVETSRTYAPGGCDGRANHKVGVTRGDHLGQEKPHQLAQTTPRGRVS